MQSVGKPTSSMCVACGFFEQEKRGGRVSEQDKEMGEAERYCRKRDIERVEGG